MRLGHRQAASARRYWWFWAFIAPALVIYALLWLLPLLANVPLSLTNWNGIAPLTRRVFIGLSNYHEILHDSEFTDDLEHTLIFTGVTLVLQGLLAFGVALLLDRVNRFKGFLRTVLYLPAILPTVVVGFLWTWIYQPNFGLLNGTLSAVGLDAQQHYWLSETSTALAAVIVVSTWQTVPFFMIIFLAGLQGVPPELIDAAELDGAGYWSKVRYVIIPHLQPVTVVVGALLLFNGFRMFDIVYIMEGVAPGTTETLAVYIYRTAFEYDQMGYGSAVSVVLTALVLIIAIVYLRFFLISGDRQTS